MTDRSADSARRLEWATLAGVVLLTLAVELALAERKYGLFGGGFGMSRALVGLLQQALFLFAALWAQALLGVTAYLTFRALFRRPEARLARLFSFAFFSVGLMVALVAARFELLAYFSDAVSFRLLANLGGGSLYDALLFGLSEGVIYLVAAGAALAGYVVALLLIRRHARRVPPVAAPAVVGWRALALLLVLLPAVAFAANAQRNVRYAASRMTAFGAAEALLDRATDFDGDGYSWFSPQIDRQPFDPARHPFALDIPGNGIDEDGIGGDFRLAGPLPAEPRAALPPRPRHLVVVVLESTRGDILGKRIGGRVVAPNLERLAREGSHATEAYSHVGFTTASLKSLFTGRLEAQVGAPSLFRDLKAAGYRIGVFSGQPESFGDIAAVTAMRTSADIFVDAETLKNERAFDFAAKGSLLIDEAKLLRAFDARLGDRAGWARPTFVYLNFQSAHFPYHHPGMTDAIEPHPIARDAISAANRDHVARTYWNAVAYADRRLGELVARLRALGVWDDTLLMVTGDHGEALFEDGFLGHGHVINRTQTWIPFVLSVPGQDLSGPIGLDDMRGILLGALGARQPPRGTAPVFQYIGDLDRPAAIGMMEPGHRGTTLDLETESFGFSDRPGAFALATLRPGTPDRARADRLVLLWERERWLHHLRGR